MKGNISKQGIKGIKGDTPHITFRYDKETGNLYYQSDGIFIDKDYVSTYDLADKSFVEEAMSQISAAIFPTRAFVNILGGIHNWVKEEVLDSGDNVVGYRYGQTVNVNNAVITPNSKVDLQITSEQMAIFYEKDLAFVAENENGIVTIYCIGSIPENNYTIQTTVTEVAIDG